MAASCRSIEGRWVAHRGAAAFHSGQLTQAAQLYQQAADLLPNEAVVHLNLAYVELAIFTKNPAAALAPSAAQQSIESFLRYLQLHPGDPRAKAYLIQLFIDAGEYEGAVEYFGDAAAREPPSLEALSALGEIAAKTGRFAEAIKWAEKRMLSEPRSIDATLGFARITREYLQRNRHLSPRERALKVEVSVLHLQEVLMQNPDHLAARAELELLLQERSEDGSGNANSEREIKTKALFPRASSATGFGRPMRLPMRFESEVLFGGRRRHRRGVILVSVAAHLFGLVLLFGYSFARIEALPPPETSLRFLAEDAASLSEPRSFGLER